MEGIGITFLFLLHIDFGASCCNRWHLENNCGVINGPDNEGRHPIHLAAEGGHLDQVRTLLGCGADPNVGDQDGLRPLHYASQAGHTDIVEFLLDAGAHVSQADNNARTALYRAVENKHVDVIKTLVKYIHPSKVNPSDERFFSHRIENVTQENSSDMVLQTHTIFPPPNPGPFPTTSGPFHTTTSRPFPTTGLPRKGCPASHELPITMEDDEQLYFIGARVYTFEGDELSPLACNGLHRDFLSGARHPSLRYNYIGSIFVHPGCSFYGFKDDRYNSLRDLFEGPFFDPCVDSSNHGCLTYYGSIIVECIQQMPSCEPIDAWSTVGSFDNSRSPLASTYTYSYKIGTSWSAEMMQAFSVSGGVEYSMSAGFFGLFETSLGLSVETGYDWSKTSTEAKDVETRHTVKTKVPGGMTIQIQQTKGYCDGSEVKTEMFRSIVTGHDGESTVQVFTQY